MKILFKCPQCGKSVETTREIPQGKSSLKFLSCGHVSKEKLVEIKSDEITSLDGKKPYKFQNEGIEFIERSNFRALVADEMGVGKTIQALGAFKKHLDEFSPVLIICKSTLTVQWMQEAFRWIQIPAYIIRSGKSKLFPNFKIYIISYDLLRRLPENFFNEIKFNLIILDECQHIKAHESQRTNEVRKIVKSCNHIIALSGTPIKNRISEYYPVLNMIHPDYFRDRASFIYRWVDTYFDGYKMKEAGLRRPDEFFDLTKDFIIRRTRKDVLPDLPKLTRAFKYVEFENGFKESYEKIMRQFVNYMDSESDPFSFENYPNTLAYISKMRHLCGIAKVDATFDYLNDFLLETERKLVIFLHHHAVADMLKVMMKKGNISWLEISSQMGVEHKMTAIDEFKNGKTQILLASTLSSGEGLNLQFCSDMLMMERQWNPANEEQCEARFVRIGQENPITATYVIAIDTIDEFLTQLIEKKRALFEQAMTGESIPWDESSVIKELTEIIYRKGREDFAM